MLKQLARRPEWPAVAQSTELQQLYSTIPTGRSVWADQLVMTYRSPSGIENAVCVMLTWSQLLVIPHCRLIPESKWTACVTSPCEWTQLSGIAHVAEPCPCHYDNWWHGHVVQVLPICLCWPWLDIHWQLHKRPGYKVSRPAEWVHVQYNGISSHTICRVGSCRSGTFVPTILCDGSQFRGVCYALSDHQCYIAFSLDQCGAFV